MNNQSNPPWSGVFSAITTKIREDESIEYDAIQKHIDWQINEGVHGIVALGSLGENMALTAEEKSQVLSIASETCAGRVPLLSGVAESSTRAACRFIERTSALGVDGFMVLPGIPYASDARETIEHYRVIARATDARIMLYNNPVTYKVDLTPEICEELADERNIVAIKESSDNVRRITDLRNRIGTRLQIFTGVDDLAFESLALGADGWVAGLVCAFPRETVALYRFIKSGKLDDALNLYRWFTPLLHLDVSVKFVQNIKLVEALVGRGMESVRQPRLPLDGEERERVVEIVNRAMSDRPSINIDKENQNVR